MKRIIKHLIVFIVFATVCCTSVTGQAKDAGGKKDSNSQQSSKGLKSLQDIAEGIGNPGLRSYALVEVARASASDKNLAAKFLAEAFDLARTLAPSTGKAFLEELVCNQTILLAPARLDDFLNQADPGVRRSALRLLLQRYERAGELQKALETINRLTSDDEFPYRDADWIMQLPVTNRTEKQALFARALASYKNHQHDAIDPKNDFGLLLVHVWKEIDHTLVSDGIFYMLKEAEGQSAQDSIRISISSAKGSASLPSIYEYRLFQLLPVLREIDPSAAKDLIDKYAQTKQLLDRYPEGLLSLEGGTGGSPAVVGVSSGNARLGIQSSPTWQKEVEKSRQIVAAASEHPAQAIDDADALNFPFAQADALEGIAAAVSQKEPVQANKALEKLIVLGPKLIPQARAKYMISAAETYLSMGDSDDAQAALEVASDAANELYKQDSDKDDPNTALKAFWPSAIMWQQLVSIANRISPKASADIVKSISDQDLRLLTTLALESSRQGLPPIPIMTVTNHRAGEITYRPNTQ